MAEPLDEDITELRDPEFFPANVDELASKQTAVSKEPKRRKV